MRTCMQFGTMDVLEHGRQVTEAFRLLLEALSTGELPAGWRIPGWLLQHAGAFLSRLLPLETIYAYQLYHDCGKPACRITDAEGRAHFPDHAAHSERAWLAAQGDVVTGRLIGLDMAMHLASADDMASLAALPEAASLYLTAVAEVHANAPMFGGFESTSFKSKMKHLDRRGKALLRHWGVES